MYFLLVHKIWVSLKDSLHAVNALDIHKGISNGIFFTRTQLKLWDFATGPMQKFLVTVEEAIYLSLSPSQWKEDATVTDNFSKGLGKENIGNPECEGWPK